MALEATHNNTEKGSEDVIAFGRQLLILLWVCGFIILFILIYFWNGAKPQGLFDKGGNTLSIDDKLLNENDTQLVSGLVNINQYATNIGSPSSVSTVKDSLLRVQAYNKILQKKINDNRQKQNTIIKPPATADKDFMVKPLPQ